VAGIKVRDPEAWRRLVYLYGPLVLRWCRQKGLPAVDAEDVAQEVFLTVATKVEAFRREKSGDTFRGWLRVITTHKVGDWLRRRKTHPEQLGAGGHLDQLPAPLEEEPGETSDLYRRALDLIRSEFEEASWQAFWRVAVEAQDPADVARDLALSRNAVYVAKSRILRRLREVLGEE
jgi:RNA polymerase sigma-70 factor (ECF subfamily)